MPPPRFLSAPLDHPNLARAVDYLRRWPAAYEQFKGLIDTVYPLTDPTIPAAQRAVYLGSASHSIDAEPGAIYVTVDNALCLAQAMVHELAHHKLRALGVSLESATRLITNDPAQLFDSPIRKDRKRPMTAVFHAEYSFMYVTCLDLHMHAGESDEAVREQLLMLLVRNVARMEAGLVEIQQHVCTDASGERFMDAFFRWATEVLREGNALLDANGYGMPDLG
jgi:HEXXH motif-containing protein